MHPLQQMADLIREDPSITVKRLAKELGYAEERSVYYWLTKAGYKGISDFRRAVLRGEFNNSLYDQHRGQDLKEPEHVAEPSQDPIGSVATVWLVSRFTPDCYPVKSKKARFSITVPKTATLTENAFAIIYKFENCVPVVAKGDIVIVDPGQPIRAGDLLLTCDSRGVPSIVRCYSFGETIICGNLIDGKPIYLEKTQTRIVGPVIQLVRNTYQSFTP